MDEKKILATIEKMLDKKLEPFESMLEKKLGPIVKRLGNMLWHTAKILVRHREIDQFSQRQVRRNRWKDSEVGGGKRNS